MLLRMHIRGIKPIQRPVLTGICRGRVGCLELFKHLSKLRTNTRKNSQTACVAHRSYTAVMQGASIRLRPCTKSIRQWPHETLLECPARSGCAVKIHHSTIAARSIVRYTARHAQLQSQTERFVKELEEQGFDDAKEGVEEEELFGQADDLESQLESLKLQVGELCRY